jgi:hypothetical protein
VNDPLSIATSLLAPRAAAHGGISRFAAMKTYNHHQWSEKCAMEAGTVVGPGAPLRSPYRETCGGRGGVDCDPPDSLRA